MKNTKDKLAGALASIALVAGALLICWGLLMVYKPLGVVALGVFLLLAGWALALGEGGDEAT